MHPVTLRGPPLLSSTSVKGSDHIHEEFSLTVKAKFIHTVHVFLTRNKVFQSLQYLNADRGCVSVSAATCLTFFQRVEKQGVYL